MLQPDRAGRAAAAGDPDDPATAAEAPGVILESMPQDQRRRSRRFKGVGRLTVRQRGQGPGR
ncbi:MAG: hypothetical protein MZV70_51665 [Desulfobacterales bacterium]|nr:hypothetical protein [Desulfobacterales bacterium]